MTSSTAEPDPILTTPLPIRAIVGTDLDSTLLDDDYDLISAAQCLDRWANNGVLVIPASSKTLVEMVALNRLRRYPSPLIYENGAGVARPTNAGGTATAAGYQQDLAQQDYPALCTLLRSWQDQLALRSRGFHQLSAAEVAAITGLSIQAAALAKQRQASEPILWQDSKAMLQICAKKAQDNGLQLIGGGRFVHLMPPANKGQALATLASSYGYQSKQSKPLLIGCGDSPNDAPLLAVSDACAVFPQARGTYLPVLNKPLVRAAGSGPKHWHNALTALLGETTP